jgi:hypothetical protein
MAEKVQVPGVSYIEGATLGLAHVCRDHANLRIGLDHQPAEGFPSAGRPDLQGQRIGRA